MTEKTTPLVGSWHYPHCGGEQLNSYIYKAPRTQQGNTVNYFVYKLNWRAKMENGAPSEGKDPSSFLSEIIGAPVTVKLNSGVVYKGFIPLTVDVS